MTNAVTPFATSKPSAAFVSALGAAPQESLAEGIGTSYGVLHYKGKVWSLRYRGQSYVITRPDDGSPANSVDFIILRQARNKSKSFYAKWDPNTSDGERPICASLDGITPDEDVQSKQANACAVCPRNTWKTMPDGRRTRECSDYKRLAVLLLPTLTTRLLGSPLLEPVFLRIPPASLNDLGTFGDRMNAMGWHYSSFVTRASFDPTSEYPKFKFEEVVALTDQEAPVVLPMRDEPQTLRITGEDKTSAIPGAARPQLGFTPQPTGLAIAPPVQTAAVLTTPTPSTAPPAQPLATPTPQPAPTTTGLGFATAASPSKPVVPDTGETVESDNALDEKIKSILGV
jgi:hypothetical protein